MLPRLVFMGSPEFSLPTLRLLVERYPVVGVVTQPDRPSGRGKVLTPPPVKNLALELGLPLVQPERLRHPEAMQTLRDWQPELIIVAAFGQILRQDILDLPRFGCLNVHGSLLPRWRGAAPIQAAILHGDLETGITIMRMDAGVDTGPILSQRSLPVRPDDTTASLTVPLAELGATLLVETLPAYLAGSLQPQPQDETLAAYAPMLKKEEGLLDFELPALQLERRVRAFNPWPSAYTFYQEQMLKVHRARAVADVGGIPGAHLVFQGFPSVACAEGLLVLDEVQPAGKKPMPGKVFLQGARAWVNPYA
jgi:methionyl-tRNA formyltransferase